MRIRTVHRGRELPFERDRRLLLRRLPAGAVVTRAVLTLAPYSVDPDRRFLEAITFPGVAGDWGASKTATATAVEIDLRARRRLASLVGSGLAGGPLLVDLGAGFLAVDANGGFGGPGSFPVPSGASNLPGLTVTGLRLPSPGSAVPDVSLLRIASPPTNVTVAIEGGPVFFHHLGELVDPVSTPDFADLLQALLPETDLANGCHLVPFVLHSDSIARLDLTLELDVEIAVDAMPPGLAVVHAPYRFDGTPLTAQAQLAVAVPPGMVAVAGGTAGRVQGAFEATRVVYGPVAGTIAATQLRVEATGPLAQPFLLPETQVATSVDLLLTSITAEAVLTLDIVDDLDGKPGRASMLPRVAQRTVTRDEAGSPTWLNVALPGEVELTRAVRRWLVVQAREGVLGWGASGGPADDPGLQQTRDGGLSWRRAVDPATAGPLAAQLRLRHTNTQFRMPLELRVGAGDTEVAVSLQQFAAQGAIDLDLGFGAVAAAVNTALTRSGRTEPATAEHVANGDFANWFRVGTELRGPLELRPERSGDLVLGPAVAFGPDGGTVYVAGQVGGTMRLAAFDVLCREQLVDVELGVGQPLRMLVDPTGRHLVMTTLDFSDVEVGAAEPSRGRSRLVLADASTGRTVGVPVQAAEPLFGLVGSTDGAGVFLLGVRIAAEQTIGSVVRYVGWSDLRAAAAGSELDWGEHPTGPLPGAPRSIAGGPDGSVLVLTETVTQATETEPEARESRLYRFADRAAISVGALPDVPTLDRAVDVAALPDGTSAVVLARHQMRIVGLPDLRTVATFELMVGDNPLSDARCLAIDPAGEIAVVVDPKLAAALVVDLDRRAVIGAPVLLGELGGEGGAVSVAMSPAGTHVAVTGLVDHLDLLLVGAASPAEWELTAGQARPYCLPGTGEVLARLAGSAFTTSARDTGPAAISQVLPVVGGTRYRFGFDGLASDEGAVAQLIWRGDGCVGTGSETVPVTPFGVEFRTALERVPRHDLVVESPPAATQAEIRFFTPDGGILVDHVSLVGTGATAPTASPAGWQPTASGVAVRPSDDGLIVTNGGLAPAAATQVVTSPAGQRYELGVTARVGAATVGAAVELAFADETGGAVGTAVRLPLDPLDFEDHAANGLVPDRAVEAELRVVVAPGGSVELTAIELSVGTPEEVALRFVSEAPGELTASGVLVRLDAAQPVAAPVPPGGLCRSTPTSEEADGESCYCASCGTERPVRQQEPVVTDAGRPARVAVCLTCGSGRIRVGGRLVARAQPITLPRFRAPDRPPGLGTDGRRGPAIVARLHLDVPLVALDGIGPKRPADLRAVGIVDVVGLAAADPAVIAGLPGMSNKTARSLIAEAGRLVREKATRTPF